MCAKKKPELLIQKWQRRVDDWPTDAIIPANKTLKCARCGAYTWWTGKGQRSLGYCLTCIPGASFWTITPEHEIRVINAFLAAFPGTTVSQI
jgi:hypothetical protein